MKIIEPSVGLWKQGDDVKAHVAKCARVCYGKETGNDDVTPELDSKAYAELKNNKH